MSASKTDMERIGVFSEMGYISLGDRYPKSDPRSKPFNEAAYKGKQMLPGGSKTRSALQAGYFQGTFNRIMEKEAYTDAIKQRRQGRIANNKKNITSRAFLPSSNTKRASGLGSTFGTFAGTHKSFAPNPRPTPSYKTPGRNFTTTPGKKGTGYGYGSVTFAAYPEHSIEPYDQARVQRRKDLSDHNAKVKGQSFKLGMHPTAYFDRNVYKTDKQVKGKSKDTIGSSKLIVKTPFRPANPAKRIAGCKAGTFGDYPKHSEDPYIPGSRVMQTLQQKLTKNTPSKTRGIFHPSPGPKSIPTKSVMDYNVNLAMNKDNFKTMKTQLAF